MKILGISCFYHDAAAALVIDGLLVAAAAEERFSRLKHDPEFPGEAIDACLRRGGVTVDDLNHIVFYDKPFTKLDRLLTGYMATPFRSCGAFVTAMSVWLRRKLWTDHVIRQESGFRGEVLFLTHHLSHAAGAYLMSPFDKAAVLTVDGVGEWATASYGMGEGNRIRLARQMNYPHSLGLLYSAFTFYLGFQVNSAEYKVMGLAPYGTPRYADLIEEKLVTIHDDGSLHLNLDYFTFHHGLKMTGRRLEKLFGRPRRVPESPLEEFHQDVAASIQAVTEKIVLQMARHVRRETGMENLCMAGGVALNSKANGLLLQEKIFDRLYVQPAASDAGAAAGAALYTYYRMTGDAKKTQAHFDLGPTYNDTEIEQFLTASQVPFARLRQDERTGRVAGWLAQGKIVALYHGAMEFGPRALGFRSILADPRDVNMKEKINAAVKYRERFRPFAPAVSEEAAGEYFACEQASPFMLFNFTVRPEKRDIIPAVTHVDRSSRIQTVNRKDNAELHDILRAFQERTGVPVLLNTSFNLRGHPIVNRPEEALATFCSSGIDILVMGAFVIDKEQLDAAVVSRFSIDHKPD